MDLNTIIEDLTTCFESKEGWCLELSEEIYSRFLESEDDPGIRLRRAGNYCNQKKYQEALDDYEKLLD